jgi:hypothetical protein
VASVQAFAARRVEDTPLESVKQALAETPEPAAEATGQAKPAPGAPPAAPSPEPAPPVTIYEAPPLPASDGESALSLAIALSYVGVYRGPEGVAHGPGLALEGWFAPGSYAFGFVAAGRYELPHTVSGPDLDLRLQTTQVKLGLFAGMARAERPTWVLGAGFGSDWFDFRPSGGAMGVALRAGDRARRTLAFAALGRFLSWSSLRLGVLAGVDVSLQKSHYDLAIEGTLRRELTPWQVHPNLACQVAWH